MRIRIIKIPDRMVWFEDLLNKEFDIEDPNLNSYYYNIKDSNRLIPKDCCIIL